MPTHHSKLRATLALGCLLSFLSPPANGDDNWPQFRGAGATGVGRDHPDLPTQWDTRKNVLWAAEVPGWGWSCPVVWGDRVFVTTVISEEENLTPNKGLYLGQGVREPGKGVHHWQVVCLDLNTGQEIWNQEPHTGVPEVPRHPKSTYAAETIATDGERIYALFGDVGLYCFDMDGKPLWSHKIEPQKTLQDYGAAASPVVHQGQVFVVYDNFGDSWIASFDAETGQQRWKTPRDETHSWATPLVWTNPLRTEIVVPGKNRNRSYSLGGELLWEFDGQMSNLVIPSPFAAHGLCYIASGYVGDAHRPTFAILPGASGDITPENDFADSEFIKWYQGTSSAYNTSQIVYRGYLYTVYDQGFITCHDARTGERVYGKKRFSPSGSFTASPFAYNGHLFCLSEDGLTYVLRAGPDFEIVGRNDLEELSIACPAVVGNKVIIRTASKLYCLAEGEELKNADHLSPSRKAAAYSDVWGAASTGKVADVKRFLRQGQDVNARQRGSGLTLLNMATVFGHAEVVALLIDQGADVSLASRDGNTALHTAAFFARPELVRLLLKHGAPTDIKNGTGQTPAEVVGSPWGPDLERTYKSIEGMIGRKLDLDQIRQNRPVIAELLENAAKQPE